MQDFHLSQYFFHHVISAFYTVKLFLLLLLSDAVMMSDYLLPADWSSVATTASRFNTKVRIMVNLLRFKNLTGVRDILCGVAASVARPSYVTTDGRQATVWCRCCDEGGGK